MIIQFPCPNTAFGCILSLFSVCFIDSMKYRVKKYRVEKYRVKGSWICCLLRAFTLDVLSGERGKVLRHQAKE